MFMKKKAVTILKTLYKQGNVKYEWSRTLDDLTNYIETAKEKKSVYSPDVVLNYRIEYIYF